jgi:hypothetical protein
MLSAPMMDIYLILRNQLVIMEALIQIAGRDLHLIEQIDYTRRRIDEIRPLLGPVGAVGPS